MGLENTMPETAESDDEQSASGEQRKSLIANSYSTSRADNYKDVSGWGMSEGEIALAYQLNAPRGGDAAVQEALDGLYAGGHEEFYSKLQVALGHVFARSRRVPEFDEEGIEPRGSVPAMDLLNIEGSDIVEYVLDDDTETDVSLSADQITQILDQTDVSLSADQITQILDQNPEVAQELYEVLSEVDSIQSPEASD